MATIYRKSDKGLSEIETRAHRLLPRMRSALILVDGKKTEDELRKLILAEPDETLAALAEQGFIEVASVVASKAPRTEPAPLTALGTPAAAPAAAAPAAVASRPAPLTAKPFETVRREAARALNDQLGPIAETLVIKMERSVNMAELRPLLETAAQVLRNARGAAAAVAFAEKFLAP